MAVQALSAGRRICELRNWGVSNLELQKILYIAQMFHLGTSGGQPLIDDRFEAWEYGPVSPALYARAKGFGRGPVRNVFHWVPDIPAESSEEQMIQEAVKQTTGMTPGELVSITHWPRGAWHQCYRPNERGITIPNHMILDEFRARQAT